MPHSARIAGLIEGPPAGLWLPDEIVFSLASRYHRLSGAYASDTTCLRLFGHRYQGCAHDFPSRIDVLARRAEGTLGDPKSIIRQHTILPYYLPFRSRDEARSAINALRGPSIGSLKFELGLLTSRFRAHHPLKACPECMVADRARHFVAYWHRAHQFPGCWMCPTHHAPLLECTLKSTGVGRFSWVLPTLENLRNVVPRELSNRKGSVAALTALGDSATQLGDLPPGFHFDPRHLLHTYHVALAEQNLALCTGRLKARQIGRSYLAFVDRLRGIPELASLPEDAPDAATQVRRLLYSPRTGTHPLRHLLLITWLFGSWRAFWQRYTDRAVHLAQRDEAHSADRSARRHQLGTRNLVLRLVLSEGWATSAAAREVGIDPSTAAAWLAKAGHASARRPSVLRGPVRRRVIALLKKGQDAPAVAETLGLSAATVNRVLRCEVGLHDAWREVRHKQARQRARSTWAECMRDNTHLGAKYLRMMEPAAYAWLYRNDLAWLRSSLRSLERHAARASLRVDWDARDSELAQQVRLTAITLFEHSGQRRPALWQMYQRLPELKAKLGHLERLPLTRRALDLALSGHFAITDELEFPIPPRPS